jgi:hypothetical protein
MGAVALISDARERREEAEKPLPELHFVVVPTAEAPFWWDVLQRAIDGVHGKMRSSWDASGMQRAILERRAFLCLTFHVKHPIGVTVICPDGDQFAEATDWLVWIAWSDPANVANGIAEHAKRFTDDSVTAAARSAGARRLKTHSPREGMMRMLVPLGWRFASYTFVKDL